MLWPPTRLQCARGYIRTAQKARIACHSSPRVRRCLCRSYATTIEPHPNTSNPKKTPLSKSAEARYNEIGVQQISSHIYSQVFQFPSDPPAPALVELSKDHLQRHQLYGKNQDDAGPIAFELPKVEGRSLDEHFYKLGMAASQPFLQQAKDFAAATLPERPRRWLRKSGWTKYHKDGSTEAVNAPEEEMLSFDVEVMWKESPFPVMACAASPNAWYGWLSPWLLGESDNDRQLVSLGNPNHPRIVVGHNIGYDRARVSEEYSLAQSKNFFIDTMSLHVAVNGMCSQQRPTWMKHQKDRDLRDRIAKDGSMHELNTILDNRMLSEEEEELWVGRSSVNSLRDVAKFHCGVSIDKAQRDYFGQLDRTGINNRLDELFDYCAADVAITHRVYTKVFTSFLETCPHPVSFGALRHLSSVVLPVDDSWEQYLEKAESTYQKRLEDVRERLVQLSEAALQVKEDPKLYQNDPWLQQLDWSGQEVKMNKPKKKGEAPKPAARQKKPGMPKWYKDLFATNNSPMNLTVRTRIAPLLLKLSWDGYPLVWSDVHGWTFRVPYIESYRYENSPVTKCDMSTEKNAMLRDDLRHAYFKLPHKDGPSARCASPLAKGYLPYFEAGTLSSQFALAKEALDMNASCSYWISARDRITSQLVVRDSDLDRAPELESKQGYILPQVIPMGTITRRAVENTWLTASNAKANRVGSELKAMVKAPPGYSFVGADVDSQELWIASLVGDAQFQLHGGNAIGFMTLEGTKAAGTDLHSKTAKILGISRNDAKVFNYGRIYGAGLKFAATLLRQFNPALSEKETNAVATKLYQETKGTKTTRRALTTSGPFWRGGTESFVFNKLEEFAEQERPRTPVLGAGITEALMRRFINKGSFMTSRINWAIQSSGVDYLHLLIISMDYLIQRFNLDARLAITVHDEIRFLVKSEDRYKAAMALQVANVWTRAMFSQQMGINDLPQSCAYFSAIDIDHVLRKEVDMDCVTPSHANPIPPGESLNIQQLLDKGEDAYLDPNILPVHKSAIDLNNFSYTPRPTVMSTLESPRDLRFLRAQITNNDNELKEIVKEVQREAADGSDGPGSSGTSSRGASRVRRPRIKAAPPPPYAQPQKAMLMEVDQGWGAHGKKSFSGSGKPWFVEQPSKTTGWSRQINHHDGAWEV